MTRHNLRKAATTLLATLVAMLAMAADHYRFFGPGQVGCTLITSITQDANGYVWVGTERGLDRFDGYRFVTYKDIDGDGRPTVVASLLAEAADTLWVGTAHGLFRCTGQAAADPANISGGCRFAGVAFPDSLLPRVAALVLTADGHLLAGTAGYGLYDIDRATLTARPVELFAHAADTSYFNHLFLDRGATLWKGGKDEHIAAGPRTDIVSPLGPPVAFFEHGGEDYALCHHGAVALRPGAADIASPKLLAHFLCCATDSAGNVYAGTRGEGLFWLPRHENAFRRLHLSIGDFDLDHARVEALYADRDGNVWAGCSGRGLLLIAPSQATPFQTWDFASQGYATGTYVSALADGTGDVAVWACVQGDGIYGFDTSGSIVAHTPAPSGTETLLRTADGRFWLGTANRLWRCDPLTGGAECVATLPGDRVAAMVECGDGCLAVSTFGAGVALFDSHDCRVMRRLSMHDATPHSIVNDWVYALDTDSRGRLWLATASGVCRYVAARGCCDIDSLGPLVDREECTAIRVLASGDVLMATSRGLLRWTEADGLRPEQGTEGLRGRVIAAIVEDGGGKVWLSTDAGIWLWEPAACKLSAQTSPLSSQGGEYVQGAYLRAADGHILFATADDVTRFHPDSLQHRRPLSARVRLTAFHQQGHDVQAAFSLMDFLTTGSTVFEYRFEGDHTWQQLAPGQNALSFTHLAPGDYTLNVRASIAGQTTQPETYAFEVLPPWWQTWWAYALYALLAAALAALTALAYRRHVQYQMDRQKLSFLISAANDQAAPLTLDELQTAIAAYVQSRKQQTLQLATQHHNAEAMAGNIETPQVSGNDEQLMQRITQSVNRHLGDSEFSVEQMCEEVGISRAHLHRKMKELTGFTTTEFIRNIRLEQAARLLRERKLNITQVAYTVGFSNLGYFSTVFRKHFGMSPRDFVERDAE